MPELTPNDFKLPRSAPPRTEQEKAAHIKRARLSIKKGRVFFYPASGVDWRPIRRFSRDCDTFVYCDWQMSLDYFTRVLQGQEEGPGLPGIQDGYPALGQICSSIGHVIELEPQHLVDGPVLADPSFLTVEERANYESKYLEFANKPPWGRLVPLTLEVDGTKRRVTLIYLCAEGVATYLQLFNAQGVAPTHLCIVNCGDDRDGWTDFRDYAQPLGRAVSANAVKPELLVCDYAEHNWPWDDSIENLDWAAARVYEIFDPRVYFELIFPIRGDIFAFAPRNCDACALWLATPGDGRHGLYFSWIEFVNLLGGRPGNPLKCLRHDQWLPLLMGDGPHPWQVPMGNLIKIDPAMGRLRYIYVFPNIENQRLTEPEQAHSLVMGALETLNEAGAEDIAMNGILGAHPHRDEQIRPVMVDAIEQWSAMEHHRSERSIQRIYLVDLRGGFNVAPLV